MTFEELTREFIEWNQTSVERAASTIRAYRSRLKPLVAELGQKELADITPLDLQKALNKANEGKAPDTQRLTITVCETIQRFAVKFKILDAVILDGIEKPAGRKRDRIPTPEETRAILNNGPKDLVLLYRALRQTGARPNELCRATVADWDREIGFIVLTEHKTARKTGVAREIPVGKKLEAILQESLGDRTEGHLFLRSNGTPWTVNAVGAAFRRLRKRLGLSDDLIPYLARHEAATIVCGEKGIHAAAELLGHKNLATTQRYAKRQREKMRESSDLID